VTVTDLKTSKKCEAYAYVWRHPVSSLETHGWSLEEFEKNHLNAYLDMCSQFIQAYQESKQ